MPAGMPLGAPLGVQFRPVLPPQPVVVPQMPQSQPHEDDGPPSKKAKTEDNLIPEPQWLMTHPVCEAQCHFISLKIFII